MAPPPVFLNLRAGRADELCERLAGHAGLDVRAVEPDQLSDAVADAVRAGATRVAIAGGDGTIASTCGAFVGADVELAVIPGGTLNHFARDLGIPVDLEAAADLAATGTTTAAVDVGFVNDLQMLNTSAVGAYPAFVRARERLERRFGYRIASVLAGFATLRRLRPVRVELEVEGIARTYRTPLLFVGVDERELRVPTLGGRVENGRRGLQVVVVRRRTAWGLIATTILGALRGIREVSRGPTADVFLVERCTVHLRRRTIVAVDGELVTLATPLEYRLVRDALRVVVPAPAG